MKIFTRFCPNGESIILTNFRPMFPFYIVWKPQTTKGLSSVCKAVFRAYRKHFPARVKEQVPLNAS